MVLEGRGGGLLTDDEGNSQDEEDHSEDHASDPQRFII